MSAKEHRRTCAIGRSILLAPLLVWLGCDLLPRADAGPPIDAGGDDCAFDRTYTFHNDGSFVVFTDWSTLSPPRTHLMTRDHLRNSPTNQCTRALMCGDSTRVDLREIQQALAHPDVVAALAQTARPFYGTDDRPLDGTVFMLDRDDGRGFSVGSNAVPGGLRALVDLLNQLQTQTAAAPECAGL